MHPIAACGGGAPRRGVPSVALSNVTRRARNRPGSEGHGDEDYGKLHFLIYHDDGVEETELDLNAADDGWNYLGSYYISRGEAKLEETNRSEGRVVIADAVKWVAR